MIFYFFFAEGGSGMITLHAGKIGKSTAETCWRKADTASLISLI